jgi:hypothetical protein
MKQKTSIALLGLSFLLAAVLPLYGQLKYSMSTFSDGNGNPIMSKKAVIGESSYLFNNNYLDAVVYLSTGKPIIGNKFKLNLQENKLYYVDENNVEMEVISPVKRIEFNTGGNSGEKVIFEKGFPPVDKLSGENYYQALVSGTATLLLDTKFDVVEYKEYNSAVTTRRTDKLLAFYGVSAGGIIRLTKPEDLIKVMADKASKISAFMQIENIKMKKQADLEKIFRYYNGLK